MEFIMRLINNPAFRTFIAQYLGTRLLDGAARITNDITDEWFDESPQKELIEIIGESINKTITKYNLDKDPVEAQKDFLNNALESVIQNEDDLGKLLHNSIGSELSDEMKINWIAEFYTILSYEEHERARSYFQLLKSDGIEKKEDILIDSSKKLEELISELSAAEQFEIVSSHIFESEKVINRTDEKESLYNMLNDSSIVYIGGMHGIGKTAFINKYVKHYRGQYNQVIYLYVRDSVKNAVVDDSALTIKNLSRRNQSGYTESDEQYYQRKLSVLKKTVSKNDLFIIDNVRLDDASLYDILQLESKFVFITTNDVTQITFDHIQMERFDNFEDVLDLFFYYYGRLDIERDDSDLKQLLEKCRMHTLTVKLLALQMKVSHRSPKEVFESIKANGFQEGMSTQVYVFENGYYIYKPAFEFIRPLFRMALLPENSKRLLSFITIFGELEIRVDDLRKWTKLNNTRELVNELYHTGWVIYSEEQDLVSIHPVIAGVVNCEMDVSIKSFYMEINRIMSDYSDFELNALDLSTRMYNGRIAKYLYSLIDDFELFYPFLTKAERALSYAYFVSEALDCANEIEKYIDHLKYPDDLSKGRIIYCEGWTYATQLKERNKGLSYMTRGLGIILNSQSVFSDNEYRLVSDILGDISLNRTRDADGDLDSAINNIKDAIKYYIVIQDNSAKYYARLSWLEAFAAECCIKRKELKDASVWLDKSLQHLKDGPGATGVFYTSYLLRKVEYLIAKKNYTEALKFAIELQAEYLKYYPFYTRRNIDHFMRLGNLYSKNKYIEDANRCYRSALIIVAKCYGKDSKEYDEYKWIEEI